MRPPPQISELLGELLDRGIDIWLLGSRANPGITPPNDWDVLAFGDLELLERLRETKPLPDLDLLVVYDGDNFEGPWPRESDGAIKSGSLASWKWELRSGGRAQYQGNKILPDGEWDASTKAAIKITAEDLDERCDA